MNENKETILFNCGCNWKNCTLEYLIKREEPSPDTSRNTMLPKYINAAESITDWVPVYDSLCTLKPEKDASSFSNYQANCNAETLKKLEKIRSNMLSSLNVTRQIHAIRTQFLLQLVMMSYYEGLLKNKVSIETDTEDAETIDIPKMAEIFMRMALSDKDCKEFEDIRKILVSWEGKN